MSELPARGDGQPEVAAGPDAGASELSAVAALGEPARRALYAYVVAQGRPVSREEAAAATSMKRATAAFHLDRLVAGGLLEVAFARPSGRSGPGAGRTAKLYARSCRDIAVSLPPRRYELAGEVLATAIEEAQLSGQPVQEALARVAGQAGRRLARTAGQGPGTERQRAVGAAAGLTGALAHAGYEPRTAAGGEIELANCPFHELAQHHPALVCGLNLHLLRGLLTEMGSDGWAQLRPAPGRCCVTITSRCGRD